MNKFLELHDYFLKNGVVCQTGLVNGMCCVYFDGADLDRHPIFRLVMPTDEELETHQEEGFSKGWWGSLKNKYDPSRMEDSEYNGFRQNIILLCAAMNGEL